MGNPYRRTTRTRRDMTDASDRSAGRTSGQGQNQSTVPRYTGGQAYTAQASANLPRPGQFLPGSKSVQNSRQVTTTVPSTQRSGPLDFVFKPYQGNQTTRAGGTQVNNLRATSTSKSPSLASVVAGPYRGNSPVPSWTGKKPGDFMTPSQPGQNQSYVKPSGNEVWRQLFGMAPATTYKLLPSGLGGVPPKMPNQNPATRFSINTPYGDIAYHPEVKDWANYSPGVSARGWFDDTLKYLGTGTTTTLYNPVTMVGTGYGKAPAVVTPAAPRDPLNGAYDAIENVRTNRGAPSDNVSEAEFPAYTGDGYGDGYGGGGYGGYGGGGYGGYEPTTKKWLQNLASWRL